MLSKILKTVLVVLIVIVLASACLFVVKGYSESSVALIKSADIHIPEKLDADKLFGLFFYNADGTYIRTTANKDTVNFDPTKPTMIFFHGVQMNMGYNRNETVVEPEGWVAKGYNVASFFWSQMADFMPNICVDSVWSRDYIPFKYEENGVIIEEKEDCLNYSLAECFIAYYVDFMSQYNYTGSHIYFQGLSLGGNMLTAVNSYLLTLEKNKLVSTSLLPDRVTYYDTYMSNAVSDIFVPWLNKTIGENGTLKMTYEVAKELRSRGISVEYVASSIVSSLSTIGGGDKDLFVKFTDQVTLLNFDASYAGMNEGIKHIAGKDWYHTVINEDIFYDYTADEPEEDGIFAPGPNTPISYTYARMGSIYDMNPNQTKYDFEDDVIKSTNITAPKIAGFAYNDLNNNGINDDRIYNRINGVVVELFDSNNNLVASTVTANGGYYEFLLKTSDLGKNFYIKIKLPQAKVVGKYDTGTMLCMGNGIKASGQSEMVAINSVLDAKIINIGLIKE